MKSNQQNFENWLTAIGFYKVEAEDNTCFAMGPDGEDSDIQWNDSYVYGEGYKYKYSEIENISKQMNKETKGYKLLKKQSYKQYLNAEQTN